ncbi:TPA: restriction endonuclease subunit S [Vibrio vulnificus]|nr:restriction endonuclease subunit S [Vibrio vulnificus]
MSFFQNHSSWPLVELKNIATLKRGYDLPTKLRVEGEVPIYAANGRNGTHNEVKIKGPGVITGRSGTIGKVHYTEDDYWPLNTALYVTNFHGNDPRWVYYMLSAFKLERFVEGAGVPTLNRNLVHDELIPLPPLDEQKRIAAILDKADAIRQKRKQAIALADEFLRSVFLEMFGDPVTNPKGWEVYKMSDVIEFKGGHQPPKSTFVYEPQDGYVRLIQIRDFKTDKYVTYIPEEKAKRKFEKDDVMIARYGPPVFQILRGLSGSYNVALMKASPVEGKITKDFIFHLLQLPAYHDVIVANSERTAGQTGVNLELLNNFKVPLPDIGIQREIVKKLNRMEKVIESLKNCECDEASLFKALSQKAFSGQL